MIIHQKMHKNPSFDIYSKSQFYNSLIESAIAGCANDSGDVEQTIKGEFDGQLSIHGLKKSDVAVFLKKYKSIRLTAQNVEKYFDLVEFFRYEYIINDFANRVVDDYIIHKKTLLNLIWQYPSIQNAIKSFFEQDNTQIMNDSILEYISKFIEITELHCNSDKITDTGLLCVADTLKILIIKNRLSTPILTNKSIRKLTQLTYLCIECSSPITSDGYENLTNLVRLHVEDSAFSRGAFKKLANLEELVGQFSPDCNDDDIKHLINLRVLCIDTNKRITDGALQNMSKIEVLRPNNRITDLGIRHMVEMQYLHIGQCMDGTCLKYFPKLTSLRGDFAKIIHTRRGSFTMVCGGADRNTSTGALFGNGNYAGIKLGQSYQHNSQIDHKTLEGIAHKNLKCLAFRYSNTLDDDILKQMINLEELDITGCPLVTDNGLKGLTKMRILYAQETNPNFITAAGITNMINLEKLYVPHESTITIADLAHLPKFQSLAKM